MFRIGWLSNMQKAFMRMGFDESTSATYAVAVGDTPLVDGDDLLIEGEGGEIIATVSNSEFERELAAVGE